MSSGGLELLTLNLETMSKEKTKVQESTTPPLLIASVSERLSLDEINRQAKEWAKERSIGNKKQDEECEYDFKCGMLAARSFLNAH
jgi:hypothetical protein